jgi:hypothetical protein
MTQCPCTPIFELTEQLIGHMGATVVRACLEGDERGISAGLVLERDGAELLLPCHPAGGPGAGLAGPGPPRRFRRSLIAPDELGRVAGAGVE